VGRKTLSQHTILRGVALLLSLYAVLPVVAGGQPRVENPSRPPAKNAGRVVNLVEVLRIRDDGETAVFKSPRFFRQWPDGLLSFLDFAEGDRVYTYGPDGRLVHKLLKNGQGPGECQRATNFIVAGDRVRVLSWVPPKIMDFDPAGGRYLKEARVEGDSHGLWFLGTAKNRIYGIRDEVFNSAAFQSRGVFTVPNGVYEISPDFRTWTRIAELPVRMLIRRKNSFRLDPIDASIGGETLYVVHTAEYRVTEIDLRTGTVKRIISRAYDRIRAKPEKPENEEPETRGVEFPEDPFVWDIDKIHAAAGKLWVFTSAMKPDGDDQHVDIFDGDGRYVDSVVLRYPPGARDHRRLARWTLLTDDGLFIVPEQEEDGLVCIGKYRVVDAGLFPSRVAPERRP
jgi:hypothetical protein